MIPIRLEMKNFLPYRSPDPVFFEGIHLACLTGDNGAGKSSMLDAMTWVLWGKARARRDDDLVHLGREEMYVQLDFEQEGVLYRVWRRRKVGRRGHGELHLFVIQEDGVPRTINEPSMRQTQQRIDEILRLDYETFTNSAFLQQGKADVFTTKTPAERKRILSEILGLEHWALYEERVKERLKELDRTLASFEGVLQTIEEELAREPIYAREKEAAEEAFSIAEEALLAAEERLEAVESAPSDLRHTQDQIIALNRRIQNYQDDLIAVDREIATRQETISGYDEILASSENIEAGYQSLQNAREADSSLGAKLRAMSDLDTAYRTLEKELALARSDLEAEQRVQERSIAEMEAALGEETNEELAQVQVEIAVLEGLEREREAYTTELGQFREERSGLNTRKETLTAEGQEMNDRIDTLEQAEGATCPLCGQTLDEAHREQILEELITERDERRAEWVAARDRIQELQELERAQTKEIEAIGQKLADLPALRSRLGALQKQADDAIATRLRLEEAQSTLHSVLLTIQNEDYAHEVRQQMTILDEERAEIGYDRDAHDEIQNQLAEYREYESRHTRLEIAREALPREQGALEQTLERKQRIQKAIMEEEEAAEKHRHDIEALKLRVEEYNQRKQEVAAQRNAATMARESVIVAEQQLNALEHQRERKENLMQRRAVAEEEQAVYEELKLAFGKNGVPAMIIESAIPELEAAANELLARMTNGRMHLRFSTQREKASGGTMETLDIEIADELGTRPYEMYSGGEAFRINFAIRVALSKMLARRAGAHLRTLFIDEGFGTQDDEGRNKLVGAITAIQSDFDLILVITHITELRDAFPVHVVVEKTANGSMVSIQ